MISPEQHLRSVDPQMAQLIDKYQLRPLPRISRTRFEALVRAIISQQLSVKAAETIFGRLIGLFPDGKIPAPKVVARVPLHRLRSVGVSGQKAIYIKGLAREIACGRVKLGSFYRLNNEEVIEELTKIKGLGRWTAEMFLIFTLRRPDVFSKGDLGLRKAIARLYKMKTPPTERQLDRISKKWSPHRTTASMYLWRSLENF